jgi:hypothetical protein
MQRRAYQEPLNFHASRQTKETHMNDLPSQNDRGKGALFRIPEDQRKNDRYPTYRCDISLPTGSKWKLSGWVRETRAGDKFLSIAAEPFEEQRQQPEPSNSYARTTGRPEPPRSGGRGPFDPDSPLPF